MNETIDTNTPKTSWCLIPPIIWESTELSLVEKCLLGRINALQDEKGYCFASNDYLAKQLKLSSNRISHIISKLVNSGYLNRQVIYGENKQIIARYLLLNITIPIVTDNNTPIVKNNKDRIDILEKSIEENNILKETSVSDTINKLIKLFEPINPSYKTLFSNNTQRSALNRMVKEHSYEKVEQMIKNLPDIVCMPYAPKITSPIQLEKKLGELTIFVTQERRRNNGNKFAKME